MNTHFGRGTVPLGQAGSPGTVDLDLDTVCWFIHGDDYTRALRLLEQPDPDLDGEEIGRVKKDLTECNQDYDRVRQERNRWKAAAEDANEKAEKATEALIRLERSTPAMTPAKRLEVFKSYGLQCPSCEGRGHWLAESLQEQLDLILEKFDMAKGDVQTLLIELREALS